MPLTILPASDIMLPEFDSILIKGRYLPSAPVHLALSHLSESAEQAACVLLVYCESQDSVAEKLNEADDDWLASRGESGSVAHSLRQIRTFYCQRMSYLKSLLLFLRPTHDSSCHPQFVLNPPPSLMILVNPSCYFSEGRHDENETSPAYATLIASMSACLHFLTGSSSERPKLAVLDEHLDQTLLPIMQTDDGEGDGSSSPTRSRVSDDDSDDKDLIFELFDWIGTIGGYEEGSPIEPHTTAATHKMQLIRNKRLKRPGPDRVEWNWAEMLSTEANIWTGHRTIKIGSAKALTVARTDGDEEMRDYSDD